jgi:hypothetical protein
MPRTDRGCWMPRADWWIRGAWAGSTRLWGSGSDVGRLRPSERKTTERKRRKMERALDRQWICIRLDVVWAGGEAARGEESRLGAMLLFSGQLRSRQLRGFRSPMMDSCRSELTERRNYCHNRNRSAPHIIAHLPNIAFTYKTRCFLLTIPRHLSPSHEFLQHHELL